MAKFIFVTGGVVSSLGKGLASASIGNLLESRGARLTFLKIDPYINVDAGMGGLKGFCRLEIRLVVGLGKHPEREGGRLTRRRLRADPEGGEQSQNQHGERSVLVDALRACRTVRVVK